MLTKDQILAAQDLAFEIVKVPEWGGEVRVRAMTGAQRDLYEQELYRNTSGDGKHAVIRNVRGLLVAFAVVDVNGVPLFTPEEAAQLGEKGAAPLDRIFEVARRLNGIGDQQTEAAAKN